LDEEIEKTRSKIKTGEEGSKTREWQEDIIDRNRILWEDKQNEKYFAERTREDKQKEKYLAERTRFEEDFPSKTCVSFFFLFQKQCNNDCLSSETWPLDEDALNFVFVVFTAIILFPNLSFFHSRLISFRMLLPSSLLYQNYYHSLDRERERERERGDISLLMSLTAL
jgi:hypothetical protein